MSILYAVSWLLRTLCKDTKHLLVVITTWLRQWHTWWWCNYPVCTHAQQGVEWLLCLSVCLSVCQSVSQSVDTKMTILSELGMLAAFSCDVYVFCFLSKLSNKTTPRFQYFLQILCNTFIPNKVQSAPSVSVNSHSVWDKCSTGHFLALAIERPFHTAVWNGRHVGTRTLFGNFFGNNRHSNYARIMRE